MAYDIYGNYLRPGHCEVHPDVAEPYPCWICLERYEKDYEKELEPTDEEICEASNHVYHGDDEEGGRCYCGAKRYSRGGPKDGKP